MSYIQGADRAQALLFPEVLDEYVTEDNPVRFLDAFVDSLDLGTLGFSAPQPRTQADRRTSLAICCGCICTGI